MTSNGFGYKTAWLAAKCDSSPELAAALGLNRVTDVAWNDGVDASYAEEDVVFVTPPIDGWVLAVGTSLCELGESGEAPFAQFAADVSRKLDGREVQYFVSHRIIEAQGWARCRRGEVERAYCYLGESGEVLSDEGAPTREEQQLGFRFFDARVEEASSDEYWDRTDLEYPSEDHVMRLAGAWSVDPSAIEDRGVEFPSGLCGRLPGPRGGAGRVASPSRPWWKVW